MSISSDWLSAQPGAVLLCAPQEPRATLKPSKRPKGSPPVTLRGPTTFLRDDKVGSTDSLIAKSGVRDLILDHVDMQVDDRAGLKTEGPNGARKVTLLYCRIFGLGVGPTLAGWTDTGKWGQHHYFTGAWSEIGTLTEKVFQEHAWYGHQIAGNHAFSRCVTRWCGRTRIQIVNRMSESGTPMPDPGYGDITIIDDDVEDVCLEMGGGGSVYTFRGGMPDTTIRLERTKVRLGCNPMLASPFNRNITGALVTDSSPESNRGAGDAAHPGGQKRLEIIEPDWEIGTVWPGVGSARRSMANIGALQECVLDWGDAGRMVMGPKAHPIALEVKPSCRRFTYVGDPAEFRGRVKYYGVEYLTWAAFAAAHPECRA